METEEVLAIGFVIMVIILGGGGIVFLWAGDLASLAIDFIEKILYFIKNIFAFGSIIAIIVIAYATIKFLQLSKKNTFVFPLQGKMGVDKGVYEVPQNKRWQRVEKLFASENPSDWKIAILEADIMLDDLVRQMGYKGETLGECLKQIEPSDFITLNEAWEAHNFRNRIAHEPDTAILRRDVNRVIGLFEKVFREFSYI